MIIPSLGIFVMNIVYYTLKFCIESSLLTSSRFNIKRLNPVLHSIQNIVFKKEGHRRYLVSWSIALDIYCISVAQIIQNIAMAKPRVCRRCTERLQEKIQKLGVEELEISLHNKVSNSSIVKEHYQPYVLLFHGPSSCDLDIQSTCLLSSTYFISEN